MSEKALRNKLLLAMSEVHSGNGEEGKAILDAIFTALAEEGYVIVPRELDHKNMDHWKVASAGIRAIEEFGGELGSDHTPERQIADAYRDMISAMISAMIGGGDE